MVPFPVPIFLFYSTDITNEFLANVKAIFKSEPKYPTKTDSFFSLDNTATENNSIIMEEWDFEICKLIEKFKGYHIDYGCEFRNPETLELLLKSHPLWPTEKSYLTDGIRFPLDKLPDQERLRDLTEAIVQGNHK